MHTLKLKNGIVRLLLKLKATSTLDNRLYLGTRGTPLTLASNGQFYIGNSWLQIVRPKHFANEGHKVTSGKWNIPMPP